MYMYYDFGYLVTLTHVHPINDVGAIEFGESYCSPNTFLFSTKDTPWYYKIISNTKIDGCFNEKNNTTKTKRMPTTNSLSS